MKTISSLSGLLTLLACIGSSVSCMTSYDAYGRQVQSVDPGVALVGVAAAGITGYALSNNRNNNNDRYNGYGGGYYGSRQTSYYEEQDGYYGNGGGYDGYGGHQGGYYDSYTTCY